MYRRIFPPAPAPPSPAAQAIPEAAEEQDLMTESTISSSGKAPRGSENDDWEAVSGAEAEEVDKVDLVEDGFSVVEGAKNA